MANGSGGMHLAQEIIRGIAREYGWIDFLGENRVLAQVDPKLYDDYIGQYELDPHLMLLVNQKGDRLYVRATDQRQLRYSPNQK